MDINTAPLHFVTPAPPLVADELAHIGAGLRFAENPTDYLKELRARYGDTFLVDVFGYKLFCLFSPKGLESLYSLPEEQASFGLATFDLLSFKTPLQVFLDTDLNLFYQLLAKKRLPHYLAETNRVLAQALNSWEGELEIFDAIRTLEQRIGFGLWICPQAAELPLWQNLKQHFDVLDQEKAFVDPSQTLRTLKNNKREEQSAIEAIQNLLEALSQKVDTRSPEISTLAYLHSHFADFDPAERQRRVAHNTININQGFLSNLYAAIAWVLVRVLQDDSIKQRMLAEFQQAEQRFGADWRHSLDALDSLTFMEQMLMESVRLAQRSITLRKVLSPCEIHTENGTFTANPGVYITTLLSVGNTRSEELERFDPDHYRGNRLKPELIAEGPEQVSTFGPGRHACPAQRFSHMMCKAVLAAIFERFEPGLISAEVAPSSRQMGGVARSALPARVRMKARS